MQKVVITGFGFMGGMHAQVYLGIPQAKIAAIVDERKDAAQAQADKIGLNVPIYASLDEALRREKVDIVDVCLPTDRHASLAAQAAEAGKNVFCEKPLALTMAEAKTLKKVVEKTKVKFMVGHCIRFWPEYQAFEAFVKSKKAGKLLSLTLQRRSGRPGYSAGNWLNQAKRSMGAALDLHIHDTDFVLHLLGKPKGVYSRATKDATGYSHIFTNYLFTDKVVHAEGGWNYPANWGFQMAFQAIFENGTVEFDSGATPSLRATIGSGKPEPLAFENPKSGESKAGTGNVSSLGGYFNELQYFVGCLEKGESPKIATLDQSMTSLAVVLAELESAKKNKIVKV